MEEAKFILKMKIKTLFKKVYKLISLKVALKMKNKNYDKCKINNSLLIKYK